MLHTLNKVGEGGVAYTAELHVKQERQETDIIPVDSSATTTKDADQTHTFCYRSVSD